LSATRIFKHVAGIALFAALVSSTAQAGRLVRFVSPQAAFEQGMGAFKAGHLELAVPALEHAASRGILMAQYYLARIYADTANHYTDHAKAYMLYQHIADEHADIDPDADQRSPFVAKALTALARYVKDGVAEIGLQPDAQRAVEYLHHAATFFNDSDAQFELAKIYLRGDGVPEDAKRAMHWLSVLTQRGHAGAQAFLADLYWRGKYVTQDQLRALALISVAVEHAPGHERIWIEDIHQNIFCGASEGTRRQAEVVVADWRRKYGRANETADLSGLGALQPRPMRTCNNGEPVLTVERGPSRGTTPHNELAASPAQGPDGVPLAPGNVMGFGLREVGATVPAPKQ
jgi:TPR repeat protein